MGNSCCEKNYSKSGSRNYPNKATKNVEECSYGKFFIICLVNFGKNSILCCYNNGKKRLVCKKTNMTFLYRFVIKHSRFFPRVRTLGFITTPRSINYG